MQGLSALLFFEVVTPYLRYPMPSASLSPAADRPASPEVAAPDACLNCGAERLGDYCHVCGQHHLEGRLTMRLLWSEFAQRLFKLERGFGRTFVGLSRSPGGLARSYVAGHRRPLVNPLSYFLLGTAASLFLFQEAEFREVMEAGVKAFTFLTPSKARASSSSFYSRSA